MRGGLLDALALFGYWGIILVLAGSFGIVGIIEAYDRRRKAALVWGAISGGVALDFFACLCVALLGSGGRDSFAPAYLKIMWIAFFPLAAGFWAVLLALLIPEKPKYPEPPPSRPRE